MKYLSDSSLSKFDPKLASAFLIRYMGLFLFLFVILILFFVIGQLVGSVGLFIGYAIAISLLMFIVAGTVFPAIVLDGDKSISAAIRRGRQNFWLILKPMLIWMLPTFLLVVFVLLLLVFIQSFLEGQFSSVAIGDTTLIELIFAFIGGVLGYFLSAVGVVILCDAYKAIKAKEAAAESA
ncbi:hypothetical protein FHS89_000111 [Rubricella aquisinus]|uniref:Uncharacterized protein n=2 Tax=Rubricella aquisinus TaxID=2028108 RepID=A0A840WIR9_9RHOB|nr:hypothetical protein [Rubricella aquisinus]